jgi:hypothetical protein
LNKGLVSNWGDLNLGSSNGSNKGNDGGIFHLQIK